MAPSAKQIRKKRENRLSRAAMETLSIVAYSQPITRSEIESLRGVSADNMIRQLLERGLIHEVGRKQAPGRPVQYGTTREFLEHFGLESIADLPKLDEIEQERFNLNGIAMTMTSENRNDDRGIRINKYLSDAGKGSRRKVEELVRNGRVQIDGESVHDLSTRVLPGQEVRLDGEVVHPSRHTVVFAFNKPVRVVVSDSDPEGRPLAIDAVRPYYSGRLFSIGRLDYMSSGLILFTNDGMLAQQLMRPAANIDREYVVETREPIGDEQLEQFRRGISIEGITYRLKSYHRFTGRRVAVVLTEGKNREIRRVFSHFRLKVRRIYRNRYGPIRLGELPEGHVRELNRNEIERLAAAVRRKNTEESRNGSPRRENSSSRRPGTRKKASSRQRPARRRDGDSPHKGR